MHIERLSHAESKIVGEALRAAADGPFFSDWEFQLLFGLSREQVRRVADGWPLPNMPPDEVALAVNNALNSLLSYPHHKHHLWHEWISVDQDRVNNVYNYLRGKRNESPFDRAM